MRAIGDSPLHREKAGGKIVRFFIKIDRLFLKIVAMQIKNHNMWCDRKNFLKKAKKCLQFKDFYCIIIGRV